ncbi:GntR family transcriptional regulator [Roseomonas sp. WA12]
MSEGEKGRDVPEDSHSLQGKAFALLRDMIADGRLAPGAQLMEAQIVKAFGISRTPARSALRQLCTQGLVRERHGRGYEVAGEAVAGAARLAVLDAVKIPALPHWERMYSQLEQALCVAMISSTVRIVEERVAENFGVSRTVVRDVLARMHGIGLVTKDSLGRWVAPQVTPEVTHQMYELRWLLEPSALLQAAPHLPRVLLEQSTATVQDALDGFPKEGFDTDIAEHDLHVRALSFCPNQQILYALGRTRMLFVPTRYLFDPVLHIPLDLIADALREHLEIYRLLLDGRPSQAAEALEMHLRRADNRWLQRFNRGARPEARSMPDYLSEVD